jgi:hypothetical protein
MNRTPPTGGQIPPCIADVFMESREVLLNMIMELRAENKQIIDDMNRHQNLLDQIQDLKEDKENLEDKINSEYFAEKISDLPEKGRRIICQKRKLTIKLHIFLLEREIRIPVFRVNISSR